MEMILIRHGAWSGDKDEGDLTDRGEHQTSELADALTRRKVRPDAVLVSRRRQAQQSAQTLRKRLAPGVGLTQLHALTSGGGPDGLPAILRQAGEANVDLADRDCVLVVGHEGRLSNLVTELTGVRVRQLPPGGAICVGADDLVGLISGRGRIHYRIPTADHQEERIEAKLHSKLTVTSLLAGFVLTALSAVLVLEKDPWPPAMVVAVVALTGALALLLSAIFVYDQLSTPPGFWTDAEAPRGPWAVLARRQEQAEEREWLRNYEAAHGDRTERGRIADDRPAAYRPLHDGPAYCQMVRTSRRVFTPAVLLAVVGLVALLVQTGDGRIWGLGGLAVLVAAGWAAWHRPPLGAD
jgi:phosphohistidine phosphatase SixA